MKDLIHELLDRVLAKYSSEEIGELVEYYRNFVNDEAWAIFVENFELGNWIYEQATLADINLPKFLIDTQTARSLQEQQAAEDMEERRLEYRSSVGGGSL